MYPSKSFFETELSFSPFIFILTLFFVLVLGEGYRESVDNLTIHAKFLCTLPLNLWYGIIT